MKIKKKVQIEREQLAQIKCDICGVLSSDDEWSKVVTNDGWPRTVCHEIKVEHTETRPDYYGSGIGRTFQVDLCPKCFDERLVPWLREQGAIVEYEEYGW